jgi:hypothetical protein
MNRDLDLFRRILKDVEALPPGKFLRNIKYPKYEKEIINEHIRLLKEAGFIDAFIVEAGIPKTVRKYEINRLTNLGHDFLKDSNNTPAWNMTKKHFIKSGVSFSLRLATEYLKMKVKEKLNIP